MLTDPRAFLFDRSRNLLVLPVTLRGLPETIWMDPRTNYTVMANGTLEGAAVLGIDVEYGITDRGTVVHAKNT